jgi:hypothetical protein
MVINSTDRPGERPHRLEDGKQMRGVHCVNARLAPMSQAERCALELLRAVLSARLERIQRAFFLHGPAGPLNRRLFAPDGCRTGAVTIRDFLGEVLTPSDEDDGDGEIELPLPDSIRRASILADLAHLEMLCLTEIVKAQQDGWITPRECQLGVRAFRRQLLSATVRMLDSRQTA